MALVVRALFHWLGGSVVKVKRRSPPPPGCWQQRRAQPPSCARRLCVASELPVVCLRISCRCSRCDLVMQPLRCVGEKVAMLVDGAALGRHIAQMAARATSRPRTAVDDQKVQACAAHASRGHRETAARPPLSRPMFFRQQYFLAVLAHSSTTRSEIDVAFVEPHSHHGAVENPSARSARRRASDYSRLPVACTFRTPGSPCPCLRAAEQRASARRTRRVFGAGQIGAAISASAARVRR